MLRIQCFVCSRRTSVIELIIEVFSGNLLLESCTNPKEDPKSDQPGGDQNYMLNIIDMVIKIKNNHPMLSLSERSWSS